MHVLFPPAPADHLRRTTSGGTPQAFDFLLLEHPGDYPTGDLEEMAWNILMGPPVADDGLRRNLSQIGCPYGEMAMAPNYKHQVWKDPDASDDDVVVPALAGVSSDDELGMDDEGHAVYIAQANEFDTDDELGLDD